MRLSNLLAIVLGCCLHSMAQAAVTADFRGGSHVSGPRLAVEDLTGRVVLVEYWGVNCPPCLASIPHISALQEKYGRDQFVIIANQCQSADDATAKEVFQRRAGSDLITVINHGVLPGAAVTGIPTCFLFSHEGKLLYEGSPFDVDAAIETAVKNSPGFLVADRTFTKLTKPAAAIGAMRGNLSGALKTVRTAANSEDVATRSEAEHLLGKVTEYSDLTLRRLTTLRHDDAPAATELLARMLGLFAGDELGKPYEALVKELKSDKAFQAELKAGAMLADITMAGGRIGLDDRPQEAKRDQRVAQIIEQLRTLMKKYPDTKAASQAVSLARKWGI